MKAIHAYLFFDGNCRQAMTFYQEALGAKLDLMPYSAAPGEAQMPAGGEDRIMHAALTAGSALLMASDTPPGMSAQPSNNFAVSLSFESAEELENIFHKMSAGGQVTAEPHDAFWGSRFAMLIDKFGVHWMFSYDKPDTR